MKILLWDIETSPMVSTHWGLWDQNINHDDTLEDWKIICAAWKWLDEEQVSAVKWKKTDNKKISPVWGFCDKNVVKTLHRILSKADMLVGHNADAFDLKKFNTRCIQLGLKPLGPIPSVDTLKVAKKHFKFSSNKLDYISKYLGSEGKMSTPKGLWNDVIRGVRGSLDIMVEYNKKDVIELETVYLFLLPWIENHLNRNLFSDGECCPNCGSKNLKSNGYRTNRTIRYKRLTCQDCGKPSKGAVVKHPVKVK